MRPNSEINEVHTSYLGDRYETVKSYLCDDGSLRRRLYRRYIDSVYRLRDGERSITFQSERLLPRNDRGLARVLLLSAIHIPDRYKKACSIAPILGLQISGTICATQDYLLRKMMS